MKANEILTSRALRAVLRASFKVPSRAPLPLPWLRGGMAMTAKLFRPQSGVVTSAIQLGGVPCEWVRPVQPAERTILHVHGGAFFAGSPATHRGLASEMALRSMADVYVVDYRLAPEHPWPAAEEDCLAAYKALLAEGHDARRILLSGDSAGGGLILRMVLLMQEQGLPLPAGLIMMSPFVDLTLTNPSVRKKALADPMLTAKALRRGAKAYSPRIELNDARVSPLFAELQNLPPILIQVGRDEVLLDDSLRLTERAKQAGVWVDCQVYDGMWHDFQLFADFIPTASHALDNMAGFARALVRG